MTCKLSIIIVSWNTRDLVKLCIGSIIEHIDGVLEYEIIVVDNDSSDGTQSMIEADYADVILIKNTSNVGFAQAVNQGACQSRGKYLLLLNSDAEIMDSEIGNILNIMDNNATIGVATGRMVDSLNHETPSYYRFPGMLDLIKSYTIDRIRMIGHSLRGVHRSCEVDEQGVKICDVDWVSGGYLIARTELQTDNGLLESEIFMYFEDVLLCKRAWNSGYRVVYVDAGTVMHAKGASAKQVRIKAVRYSYEGSRIYVKTVYGDAALRRYEAIIRCGWKILAIMLRAATSAGAGSRIKTKQEMFESLLETPRIS